MFRIGDFSKLSKLTIKTLRYYDETGLLRPAAVDEWTGYRLYTTAQLVPLQRIVALRQAGLTVEEVTAILSGQDGAAILQNRRKELEAELSKARGRLSRLDTILRQEDIFMDYQAVIRTLPKCTVFYKEGVILSYADLTGFILLAGEECRAANPTLKCLEPDYCFVTYVDHEYREVNVGLKYAQAVAKRGTETDTIHFQDLEAVEAVCVYHRGPYDQLGKAYAYAMNWLEENSYQVIDAPRECYIDGCWNKESPQDYLTELQFPIRKRG